jgi:hypothetical protein
VKIVTADGRQLEFAVQRVDADAVVGPSDSVPFDQIATLEVERLGKARSAAAVVGGLFVLAGPAMVMA